MRLSPHFTLQEMIKSQTAVRRGIPNVPGADQVENLKRLAAGILEPVRAHFGRPFSPSSGFRSPALNTALGGSPRSQHMAGEAVDFEIPGVPNDAVARWIAGNLVFDQLILEYFRPDIPGSGWVHCSLVDGENRARALTINADGVHAGLLAYEEAA